MPRAAKTGEKVALVLTRAPLLHEAVAREDGSLSQQLDAVAIEEEHGEDVDLPPATASGERACKCPGSLEKTAAVVAELRSRLVAEGEAPAAFEVAGAESSRRASSARSRKPSRSLMRRSHHLCPLDAQRSWSAAEGEHREPWSAAPCGSPSGATLPPPRISLGVHARDDDDRVTIDAVEETVREALEDENAPGFAMQNGIGFWMFENALPRRLERGQQLLAQARPLRLVPSIGVLDIRRSRWPDDDSLHRPRLRIRLRTSSQGMPTGPSRSRSSRRRSSSARWASVSGTASGAAARLSHSSSSRLSRSSGVSDAISTPRLLMPAV